MADKQSKTVELGAVVAVIERELGFPASRIRSLARRLSEAGMVPVGAPGVSPMLDFHDFGTLILALGADATIPDTPEAVSTLDRLVPEGRDPANYPEQIKASMSAAGVQLDTLIAMAAEGDDALRNLRFEIVASWPEFCVHWSGGSIQRWRELGKDPAHWAAGHRKSTTIDGKALFYAVQALFAEQADAAA